MTKKHTHNVILLISSFFILFSINTLSFAETEKRQNAINGIMDLSGFDWELNDYVNLNGQWEFYWEQLLDPEDFKNNEVPDEKNYISLPRAWNNYEVNNKKLSSDGYATYRLTIKNAGNSVSGIKIPRILTSYKLFINGELISSAGKVSADKNQMVPQYLTSVKYFRPVSDSIEIIVQVANFKHRSGGILENIKLGTAANISRIHSNNIAFELFLFGGLFLIGLYHIILFIYRPKGRVNLYFGLFSILISARTLLVGEIYFIQLFPGFSWEVAHKIQTLSYYIGIPLFIFYLNQVLPLDSFKKVNKLICYFASAFTLLVLLTPARVFTCFNPLYQFFSYLVFMYIIYILIVSCCKKRENSFVMALGAALLIVTVVNDLIFLSTAYAGSNNYLLKKIVSKGNLSSLGLLLFVFSQCLILARNCSISHSKVELLKNKLKQTNLRLEEKVLERTNELENSRDELEKAYEVVSKSDKSLKNLTQNISHDLRTPLSAIKGYVDAILDGLVKEPEQQKKYLIKVNEKVNSLNSMVQDLLDLSLLQSRRSKFNFKQISIGAFTKIIKGKYSLYMNNENVLFKFTYSDEFSEANLSNLYLVVDILNIERVFDNLIDNAIKYTRERKKIEVSFDFTPDRKYLEVKVSDNGIGISEEDLPYVFDRSYMVSKSRLDNNSRGLGLSIVKEIVESHDGKVFAESELSKGSNFFFTLPVCTKKEE